MFYTCQVKYKIRNYDFANQFAAAFHSRDFCTSRVLLVADSNDGRECDSNEEIMGKYGSDKKTLKEYFEDKKMSIIRDYEEDRKTAEDSGVEEEELASWEKNKDALLKEIEGQEDDLNDLYFLSSSSSPSTEGKEGIEQEEQHGKAESSSSFPQDTSDISDDNPSSWEPFED